MSTTVGGHQSTLTWNVFDRTLVTAQNQVTGASAVIEQGYRNAWRLAAGLEWSLDKRWQLRTGVAYDRKREPTSTVDVRDCRL